MKLGTDFLLYVCQMGQILKKLEKFKYETFLEPNKANLTPPHVF